MKNINIRNATRSDIHQLVYLRKQYLIEKYGVKEIENDNMLFFQIQRYFNEHVDKDIDIVVAEASPQFLHQTGTTLFLHCTNHSIVWHKIGVWRENRWKSPQTKSPKLLGLSRSFGLCFA